MRIFHLLFIKDPRTVSAVNPFKLKKISPVIPEYGEVVSQPYGQLGPSAEFALTNLVVTLFWT
jgi:hypothetical protein